MRHSFIVIVVLTVLTEVQAQPLEWQDDVLDSEFLPDPKAQLCSSAGQTQQQCVGRSIGFPSCWEFVAANAGDSCLIMEPELAAHPLMVIRVPYSPGQERSKIIERLDHMRALGRSSESVWQELYHEDQGRLLGHSFITRQYVLAGPAEYILVLNGIWKAQAGGPADLGVSEIVRGVIESLTATSTAEAVPPSDTNTDPKMSLGMAQMKYALMVTMIYKGIEAGGS